MPALATTPRRLALPLLLLVLAASPVFAGIDRWTPFGPTGAEVRALLVDPRAPGTLWIVAYASADFAVFKSEDGGDSWHVAKSNLLGDSFLALDPGPPEALYLATPDGPEYGADTRIFRSLDGGATWTDAGGGFGRVRSLAVAPGPPGQPGVVFAGTEGKLWRSFDSGVTFEAVISTDFGEFFNVTADPQNPGTVYALGIRRRKSTDYGTTWTDLDENPGQPPFPVNSLVVAPGDPQTLYEGGEGLSTWRSHDGGATWEGPFPAGGDTLAVDPADPETLYAGKENGLFVSHDGAATWEDLSAGLPPLDAEVTVHRGVSAIALVPERPGFVLAGTGKGLFASEDGGRHWHALAQRGLFVTDVDRLIFDPFDSAHWILRSMGDYVMSRDGGQTFAPIALTPGPEARRTIIEALAFDPFARGRLWMVAFNLDASPADLFTSQDGGTTWSGVNVARGPIFSGSLLIPAPHTLVTAGSGVSYSGDAGSTWSYVVSHFFRTPRNHELYTADLRSLVRDPRNEGTLYARGSVTQESVPYSGFGVVFRSDDAGRSWRLWERSSNWFSGIWDIAFDPFRPRLMHILQQGTLKVTTNGGGFRTIGEVPAGTERILFDRTRRGTIYAYGSEYSVGVQRSRDGGLTWEALNTGLPCPCVTSLTQDPEHPQRLYATLESGGLWWADFPE